MRRVILIKSCQAHRSRREACEHTWAGHLRRENIEVYYVEGKHQRIRVNGSLIELTTKDAYRDNSIKVREAIRFLLDHDDFDRLFVCDDDTFVHPARWLAHTPEPFEGLKTNEIPWVHGGGGWWMSREVCRDFIAGIRLRCSWDDKLATEILEPRHRFTNRPDLYAQWSERVTAGNNLITCHGVSPAEMLAIYQATR